MGTDRDPLSTAFMLLTDLERRITHASKVRLSADGDGLVVQVLFTRTIDRMPCTIEHRVSHQDMMMGRHDMLVEFIAQRTNAQIENAYAETRQVHK